MLVQGKEKSLSLHKRTDVMTKKKDLYNLHCRVEHLTAEKLKAWSEELGYSMGEVIDCFNKFIQNISFNTSPFVGDYWQK